VYVRLPRKARNVIDKKCLYHNRLDTLLKQLKNQCGAGGTLKDNEIEIQGNHTQKLLEILTKLGYKAKISGG